MLRLRDRFIRFSRCIFQTYRLPAEALVAIARDRARYTPVMRAAALRNLVGEAPLAVTQGRPFAERRRLVRAHYGV